ncbi:hypothetical protein [Methylobacterium sp. WSM2598]|uniref:hypothetical protein n=1 Tax=Methylobacterium sp. WSM2598 TaxID=398261 RepID=UPI0003A0E51E|nr:hypothetical protein [Methylobacterium sp. WSM2598]
MAGFLIDLKAGTGAKPRVESIFRRSGCRFVTENAARPKIESGTRLQRDRVLL